MAADDRQMWHAHAAPARLVDDRDTLEQVAVAREQVVHHVHEMMVDGVDDLQMARQHAAEHVDRPGFEGFRHQGVVGVGENARDQIPGVIPLQVPHVDQLMHHFRHGDGRVGIVELDANLLRQQLPVLMPGEEPMQYVLDRCGDEEILLAQPQFAPVHRSVVGVQYLGEVLGGVLFFHGAHVVAGIERVQVEFARRLGRPQAQVVDGIGLVAGDRHVVGHRHHGVAVHPAVLDAAVLVGELHHVAIELDRIEALRALEFPGIAVAQPVVRAFDLLPVFDALLEHAVFVTDAVAHAGQIEGRHRIQEAGRQAAQAAVAERGVGFHLLHRLHLLPHGLQAIAQLRLDVEIVRRIGQRAPDQEFQRKVIDPLRVFLVVVADGLHPALDQMVAHGVRRGIEPVTAGSGLAGLAAAVGQVIGQRFLDGMLIVAQMVLPWRFE
ncbi:hypothetical protein GALL_343470 [mine drainage metagenome]|uniref:Uncharacterized protein n=1 Tax=mine drainage metagenome TaxID=410659 RepID=A0A1J5QK30_9ZZZZ